MKDTFKILYTEKDNEYDKRIQKKQFILQTHQTHQKKIEKTQMFEMFRKTLKMLNKKYIVLYIQFP